jgi:hypothetical protein
VSTASLGKRLDALRVRAAPRKALPEWVDWMTYAELDELEAIYRAAADAGATELSESDSTHDGGLLGGHGPHARRAARCARRSRGARRPRPRDRRSGQAAMVP